MKDDRIPYHYVGTCTLGMYLGYKLIFHNNSISGNNAAELLGLPLIPAYSEASGDQVLHGVNYASAAAGILDITGRNFVSTPTSLVH